MSLSSLQVLADNREALLLAEVGALIHNIGKLSSAFLRKQGGDPQSKKFDHEPITGIINDYVNASGLSLTGKDRECLRRLNNHAQWVLTDNLLEPGFKSWIKGVKVSLPAPFNDRRYVLADFIDLQSQKLYPNQVLLLFPSGSRLTQLEAYSHGESSGLEKQEKQLDDAYRQSPDSTFISSVFGTENDSGKIKLSEIDVLRNELLDRLQKLVAGGSSEWYRKLMFELQSLRKGLGDTRRPANDVTLWDFHYSAACLLKPAIATELLKGWREPTKLNWRILRVNFDELGLYARAVKIADFLAYREQIDRACDAIKRLVEEEYPLGNEVYRDTTGIYFTFPDIDLPVDLAQEIRRRVEEIEMELAPRTAVDGAPGNTAAEQLRHILKDQRAEARQEVARPFTPENLNPCWQAQWENLPDGKWEVCPICRLRPMKEYADACKHCLGRRKSRIQWWLQNLTRTIWMDEIADHNGRVALIVGKFGLDDWLSGDLVQTLLVRAKENAPDECVPKNCVPKNPSPARLRRVWETTQQFWIETVGEGILAKHSYAGGTVSDLRRARLLVIPDKKSGWQENLPYDGTVNGRVISLLWRKTENSFITISNLQLVAGDAEDVNELAAKLKGQRIVVSDPRKPHQRISFIVREAKDAAGDADRLVIYTPYLGLLSSPDQFLALVPAYDALAVAEAIYNEYGRQFGKVQNRLPLFLGLVFFPRKTPLAAVIDTARRILEVSLSPVRARIAGEVRHVNPDADGWPTEVEVPLTVNGDPVSIRVRTVMGDGCTPDPWYPYWRVEGKPTDRQRYFIGFDGEHWVHVKDLKKGDVVQFTPSRFAYLFLEHTGQRYGFDVEKEALLLDELLRLQEMWGKLKGSGITDTALRSVYALLEAKRTAWGEGSQELRHLAETVIQRAELSGVISVEDVIGGRLGRCLELYLHILKERIKGDKNGQQPETATA